MPLPLFLGIAAAVAAAGGIGTGVHGAFKMKGANDTVKTAEQRHNRNIQRFEACNNRTAAAMDALGTSELEILASFQKFSDIFEKIQNRPSFKEFDSTAVNLPHYDKEEISKVSVGAGVLMGGIGGAALGTAGGFAAAGATTAAVMALGTASTGTAIASLSGVAATNATLAALGGGALAAGGGGIALGTTILGATTVGVGLLIGGIIFSITGSSLSRKAEKAHVQMLAAEKEINKICAYLNELNMVATRYHEILTAVNGIYKTHLQSLDTIINTNGKTDWMVFTPQERLVTANTVLLVQLLYKMCQVNIVQKTEGNGALNSVNKPAVEESMRAADALIRERGFEPVREISQSAVAEQTAYTLAVTALLYYFARCDGSTSPEEEALIDETVTPMLDPEIAVQTALAEVAHIRETAPFEFIHLENYLAQVSTATLSEIGTLIDQVVEASEGITSAEEEAKAKFEQCLKDRQTA